MNSIPKLAIVGRPNVGKSALFNRISGKRIAIVDEAEGITRDRLYAEADFFGRPFDVIDTGGIDPTSKIPFNESIRRQALIAIEEADSLVMVVDAKVGITPIDEQVASILLKAGKPVTLAVNKIDDMKGLSLVHEFHGLGITNMVGISAVHGIQVGDLLEVAFASITWPEEAEDTNQGIKVAVVGRPNVGKSTLVNYLLQEERCLVSPQAGTTRDSIDVEIEVEGRRFTLIDTAGIRRKQAEHEVVDKFAAIRTERAIERCDICLLMIDSVEGMTVAEKRIARSIEDQGKGCILLLNKWDLVKGYRMEHCLKAIQDSAHFLSHCPTIFTSASTGRNLEKLYGLMTQVFNEGHRRVTTGQLNKFLENAIEASHPPMLKGKRLRIYYAAQVGVAPPQFVFFVNRPDLMVASYKKYLINHFRKTFGFAGTPLTFKLRGKQQSKAITAKE
ncbi:MAG: GTPase Der [Chlamydiae bacterium]|nr:GTPase Der [Chlamydiota bacterium]